jgi:hypothetical protein
MARPHAFLTRDRNKGSIKLILAPFGEPRRCAKSAHALAGGLILVHEHDRKAAPRAAGQAIEPSRRQMSGARLVAEMAKPGAGEPAVVGSANLKTEPTEQRGRLERSRAAQWLLTV